MKSLDMRPFVEIAAGILPDGTCIGRYFGPKELQPQYWTSDMPKESHNMRQCILCKSQLRQPIEFVGASGLYVLQCPNCGDFRLTQSSYNDIHSHWLTVAPDRAALLSHKISRRQQSGNSPLIDDTLARTVFEGSADYPSALDQIENLVVFMAEEIDPGDVFDLRKSNCQAVVGAKNSKVLRWVIEQAKEQGLINGSNPDVAGDSYLSNASLTAAGWRWYHEIGRHRKTNIAFMAMPFSQPRLSKLVSDHFIPAVRDVGFRLMRMDEDPQAGVIDNRMRAEIRRCRFLICDITHNNEGAIWEAGFAEGLGKPVIYTCEQSAIDGAHFDIRNSHIIPWTYEDPSRAGEDLKATIRNTLPDEAIFED